jgi:thioesterase domain-containing protein
MTPFCYASLAVATRTTRSTLPSGAESAQQLLSLEATMQRQIPVASLLGIKMRTSCDGQLRLTAPLAGNTNHVGSAFAGSLNAVAALAAWAWLSLLIERRGVVANVVVQDSVIRYLRPVLSDFEALPEIAGEDNFDTFIGILRRKAKSRLRINVQILDASGTAAIFSGRYVASSA